MRYICLLKVNPPCQIRLSDIHTLIQIKGFLNLRAFCPVFIFIIRQTSHTGINEPKQVIGMAGFFRQSLDLA